jgi:methylmalonyl-CoA mutase
MRGADGGAGSAFLDGLAYSLAEAAAGPIDEVEALGGMTNAVAAGMPKLRSEEASPPRADPRGLRRLWRGV